MHTHMMVLPATHTLLLSFSWLSRSVSMHVRSTMSEALMLPASLSRSPALLVRDVLSDPARSTSESWDTTTWGGERGEGAYHQCMIS